MEQLRAEIKSEIAAAAVAADENNSEGEEEFFDTVEAAAAAAEEGEDDNSSSGSTMVPVSAQQSDTSRYEAAEYIQWVAFPSDLKLESKIAVQLIFKFAWLILL